MTSGDLLSIFFKLKAKYQGKFTLYVYLCKFLKTIFKSFKIVLIASSLLFKNNLKIKK
jgi:hypothetical protein